MYIESGFSCINIVFCRHVLIKKQMNKNKNFTQMLVLYLVCGFCLGHNSLKLYSDKIPVNKKKFNTLVHELSLS